MKINITLSAIISFFAMSAFAQPTIEWQKAYGGMGVDNLTDIRPTADAGFILVGTSNSKDGDVTSSHDSNEVWIAKLDKMGAISWQKTYGGGRQDGGNNITQTSDGGYIFCGSTNSSNGDVTTNKGSSDAWVVKLSATGSIEWQKTFGGSLVDNAVAIHQTSDGGYVFCAVTYSSDGDVTANQGTSDVWVVKLTSTGTISWQKTYGGTSSEFPNSIAPTSDGGYIIGAASGSSDGDVPKNYGNNDFWMFKINATGTLSWSKNYGGTKRELGGWAIQTSDGGYMISGNTNSNDSNVTGLHGVAGSVADIWVVKTDANGAITWQKAMGGSGDDLNGSFVMQGNDGNYYVAASAKSTDGDVTGLHGTAMDMWMIGLYPDNSFKWKLVLGGTASDYGIKLLQTSDGGFIVGGLTLSNDGDATNNGLHGTSQDMWVVKLGSTANINNLPMNNNIKVYPTVTSGKVSVDLPTGHENAEIKLVNLNGQVMDIIADDKGLTRTAYLNNIPTGTYLLQVINNGGVNTTKIVYQQ